MLTMPYDFYPKLTKEEQERYDLMLETNYVLLRCDEWEFLEEDETGKTHRSSSWIHSIQPTLEMFGLEPKSYPQGSTSANRHYYEAIRLFFDDEFPPTAEFNNLRDGLKNLLTLRRDDSSPNLTYLFGSYYKVLQSVSSRTPQRYRSVEVSLRHSAAALWILCEESGGNLSKPLQESLAAFLGRMRRYLAKNQDWQRDGYKHLTLGSAMKTCQSLIDKFPQSELSKEAEGVKAGCHEAILSDDCLSQTIYGDCFWSLPDPHTSPMAKYEFYLNGFVLTQVPELLVDPQVQSLSRAMVGSGLASGLGLGIPIHRLIKYAKTEEAKPDFGATASCAFITWYSLNNEVGDAGWLSFCEKQFGALLRFCLSTYDRVDYYVIPHSENNTKILFLPRFNLADWRIKRIETYITQLKSAIGSEMEKHDGRLSKRLGEIQAPPGLEHVKDIILTWNITKYWKEQKRWKFSAWTELGEFFGGYTVSALRSLNS